jgi:hypothetical protein
MILFSYLPQNAMLPTTPELREGAGEGRLEVRRRGLGRAERGYTGREGETGERKRMNG